MSKGYIVVQLFTARQARPITNATVIISRPDTGGESVIRAVQVDREGKTEPISLWTKHMKAPHILLMTLPFGHSTLQTS